MVFLKFMPRYQRNRMRATITNTGLKKNRENILIAFDAIKNITGFTEALNIFTVSNQVKMYIPKPEVIKLAKAGMLDWTINDLAVNILHGSPSQGLRVVYTPIGKYAINYGNLMNIIIVTMLFIPSYFLLVVLLFLGLYYILKQYNQIAVSIHDGGITIAEDSVERFISVDEIQSVDSGLFTIIVKTTDNRIIKLPKQCQYLLEFLLAPDIIKSTS